MPASHRIVFCTVPDTEVGSRLAEALVEEGLAACVNLLPGLTSIYRWEGKLHKDGEALLLIKTRADRFGQLAARIRQLHPYELPEIVAVPLNEGPPEYLDWIDRAVD
ncbi:divalent-cation tolerance protein CutA [Thiohalobacter sp.]|uniref:divalent-cation tolerance protein CutA n=1 Tax=Thiohalobacter sp. TaxID=2025948 RepID=UPI00260C5C1B|nr:divalent-cation tolerance protein CutA [Thiohalobacter sp.]